MTITARPTLSTPSVTSSAVDLAEKPEALFFLTQSPYHINWGEKGLNAACSDITTQPLTVETI
jgi:hypothetical protein